ncbi:MAG: CDP-diacylglycerol--glycerol-3-phosphate 3-phosphatidyltransferase [Pseudomonadota bacterium]
MAALNLPNVLTILRLLSAPGIVVAFLILPRPVADWVALVLFLSASLTDWVDGQLARAWKQETKLGAMMDPIADKAIVLSALLALAAIWQPVFWIILPAALIVFREVFVSGLREFLGDVAGTLKVTRLAKWKTAIQMVAIGVLLAKGIVEHGLFERIVGLDQSLYEAIVSGVEEDVLGINWRLSAVDILRVGGIALLWLAAVLTVITGYDYFRKALPHLVGPK